MSVIPTSKIPLQDHHNTATSQHVPPQSILPQHSNRTATKYWHSRTTALEQQLNDRTRTPDGHSRALESCYSIKHQSAMHITATIELCYNTATPEPLCRNMTATRELCQSTAVHYHMMGTIELHSSTATPEPRCRHIPVTIVLWYSTATSEPLRSHMTATLEFCYSSVPPEQLCHHMTATLEWCYSSAAPKQLCRHMTATLELCDSTATPEPLCRHMTATLIVLQFSLYCHSISTHLATRNSHTTTIWRQLKIIYSYIIATSLQHHSYTQHPQHCYMYCISAKMIALHRRQILDQLQYSNIATPPQLLYCTKYLITAEPIFHYSILSFPPSLRRPANPNQISAQCQVITLP
jgi:hypothetical protein